MATNTIKRHSDYPPLHFEFLNEHGEAVDCTEFNVYLIVKNRHNQVIINQLVGDDINVASGAVWLDESAGIGEYRWAALDNANAGRYNYEFKFVRKVDGKTFKLPEEDYYYYLVLEDIEVT